KEVAGAKFDIGRGRARADDGRVFERLHAVFCSEKKPPAERWFRVCASPVENLVSGNTIDIDKHCDVTGVLCEKIGLNAWSNDKPRRENALDCNAQRRGDEFDCSGKSAGATHEATTKVTADDAATRGLSKSDLHSEIRAYPRHPRCFFIFDVKCSSA